MLPRANSGFLEIGDTAVPFELRRSRRRRTLGLTVTPQQVRIHAPSWTPRAEIEAYVRQQHDWLCRAWARMRMRADTVKPIEARSHVHYLGRALKLVERPSLFSGVRRVGHTLYVECPLAEDADMLVRAWLQERAARLLSWRLHRLAKRQPRAPSRFALSDAATLWGSCTPRGHIRLNWRLIQAPLALIDYVAAHELAHLVHLDHSPAFWAQVAQVCPDMRERRTRLRNMSVAIFQI